MWGGGIAKKKGKNYSTYMLGEDEKPGRVLKRGKVSGGGKV